MGEFRVQQFHKETGREILPARGAGGRFVPDPLSFRALNEDLLPTLDRLHREQSRELFASEGASGGPAWPELDPKYAARKRREVGRRKIMVRTGTLREDVTRASSAAYVSQVGGTRQRPTFEFGTSNPVAGYHQDGIRRKDGTVVVRDVLQKTDRQHDDMQAEINAYLQAATESVIRAGQGITPSGPGRRTR